MKIAVLGAGAMGSMLGAYLQLGAELEFLELLSVGMELCGSYSKWALDSGRPEAPYGRDSKSARNYTYDLPPVMNANRMEAFVERMKGQRGAVGARATLRWLLDGSASPMETATYLLLCLPRRVGGYGLPKPLLNPLLKISGPSGTKERYPDLFWLGANIDVEYNSDEDHSGECAFSTYQPLSASLDARLWVTVGSPIEILVSKTDVSGNYIDNNGNIITDGTIVKESVKTYVLSRTITGIQAMTDKIEVKGVR